MRTDPAFVPAPEARLPSAPQTDLIYFVVPPENGGEALLRDAASLDVPVRFSDLRGVRGQGRLDPRAGGLALRIERGIVPSGRGELSLVVHGVPLRVECLFDGRGRVEPLRISSAERRRTSRSTTSARAYVQWFLYEEGGLAAQRARLVDVSAGGARVELAPGSRFPADSPFAVTLVVDGQEVHGLAELTAHGSGPGSQEFGLRFVGKQRSEMIDLAVRLLFPRLVLRRNAPREGLLSMMRQSGYIALRESCTPPDDWFELDADAVSRDFVYMSPEGEVVGQLSATRSHRHTWLGHHVAFLTRHRDGLDARIQLVLGVCAVAGMHDGVDTYVTGYYDRTKRWGLTFFEGFADSASANGAAVALLDRFERVQAPSDEMAAPDGVEVSPAHEAELSPITALVRSQFPALFAPALDLEPGLLRSALLHPSYERYAERGLYRGREVLALRVGGKLVGAALCEYAPPRLSLFNLLNIAYVHLVSGDVPAPAQHYFQARIRAFYRARGVALPIVCSPPNTFRGELDPAVKLAETMGFIVWSAAGLRSYENYVRLQVAAMTRPRVAPSSVPELAKR